MPWVKKKRKRRLSGRTILFYGGVTLLCAVISATFAFVIARVPHILQNVEMNLMRQTVEGERTDFDPSLLNDIQSTSQEGSQSVDLEKLKETYRDSVNKTKDGEVPNELDEIIKTYFDNIDPADLEKLKKAYLTYRKNNSLK